MTELFKIYDLVQPGGKRAIGVGFNGDYAGEVDKVIGLVLSAYPEDQITLLIFDSIEDSRRGAWAIRVTVPGPIIPFKPGDDDDIIIEYGDPQARQEITSE